MSKSWWMWGRIFYSVPLVITGFIYLYKPSDALESLTSFIPGEFELIYGAGVLWTVLGLFLTFNIKSKYAVFGVMALLGVYQIMVHIPAVYTGEHLSLVWLELLRDVSLMGGACLILAVDGHKSSSAEAEENPMHNAHAI